MSLNDGPDGLLGVMDGPLRGSFDGSEDKAAAGWSGCDELLSTPEGTPAPQQGGGRQRLADVAFDRMDRRKYTRLLDKERKRQHRKDTKALLKTLAQLEAEDRGAAGPVHADDVVLHPLLERVTKRLKVIAAESRARRPPQLEEGAVPSEDVAAGLMGARSLGTLYVCLEDWVVRSSNRGMELFGGGHEALHGYVGLALTPFVHPDDHVQLRLFKEVQAHSFKPGDPLVLSVRMLRACQDRGILVMAWRRVSLEVAHVAGDKEHEGKLHVLFTSVLEPDSLEPLTFDEADRELFREVAAGVSGTFTMDPHRTTDSFDLLCQQMDEVGFKDRNEGWPSPVADFLSGLSSSVGGSLGIPQLLDFLNRWALSTLNQCVHVHTIWGLAPQGTPRVQMSTRLHGFGLVSGYHTFISRSMSGRPLRTSTAADSPDSLMGFLKPQDCVPAVEGGVAIGFVDLIIHQRQGEAHAETGRTHIPGIYQVVHTYDPSNKAGHERTWLTFYDKESVGALPTRTDVYNTLSAPPDPGLLEKFWEFGPQFETSPFPEFCS